MKAFIAILNKQKSEDNSSQESQLPRFLYEIEDSSKKHASKENSNFSTTPFIFLNWTNFDHQIFIHSLLF
jgi:hemerythrin